MFIFSILCADTLLAVCTISQILIGRTCLCMHECLQTHAALSLRMSAFRLFRFGMLIAILLSIAGTRGHTLSKWLLNNFKTLQL